MEKNNHDMHTMWLTAPTVVDLLQGMLEQAVTLRASDIHIDPSAAGAVVRYRVDGQLVPIGNLPESKLFEVISRIKILAGMRVDQHYAPQDGRFRFSDANGHVVDVRVSIVPTYHGENAILRLLMNLAGAQHIHELGFAPAVTERLVKMLQNPHGMILTTGPTGSGKTTTLYSMLRMLNRPSASIVTIEDPIEYSLNGICQIQTNEALGLSFASGLRAVLRQDPNIIMVGEIRDPETASVAINAALTGHMLLSTLHTTSAASCLLRLLDLRVEPYLIASTVSVIISQRLLRKICVQCKQGRAYPPAVLTLLSKRLFFEKTDSVNFFAGKGCTACNFTGYRGRIGVYEVLFVDAGIRRGVLRRQPASDIQTIACQHGMFSLADDALQKARGGLTTLEELLTIVNNN